MRIIIILLSSVVFTSCVNAPIKVAGQIKADYNINPNYRGQASPIQLRFYHLKNHEQFMAAGYRKLSRNAYKTLRGDLVKTENMIVRPGQLIRYNKQMRADVRYIGVVANYRTLKHKQWKSLFTVSIFRNEKMNIQITRHSIKAIRPIAK